MISDECFDAMIEDISRTASDEVWVHLWYPQIEGRPKALRIGLIDVRYAPDIQVSYDFERNGWVIKEQVKSYDDFVEAAFIETRT
jgi:hypothetical protein